ncbi:hypothetical protein J5N97_024735 [Dioscorea zingiberensis]|uniref:Transcription factor MYBS1 n=1 Tax=Dioscorea zingiberensis TaxID=325984 RepID=A0A9D5H9B7_9LILI|nr:hypothetical protein J5N97_024735 [Dioscorea zingiberensis]
MVTQAGGSVGTEWGWEEEKAFEDAIAHYFVDGGDELWLESVAAAVPGKSLEDVVEHYRVLVEDINLIESGQVPLPDYVSEGSVESGGGKKGGGQGGHVQERRKGVAWSEEEHKQFLCGLERYGKGDWRSIARNYVLTRTPTQVASHAQKYFNRLNSSNKDRRRSSIHDITTVDTGDASGPQRPITGQMDQLGGDMLPHGMTAMDSSQLPVVPQGMNVYGVAPHGNLPFTRMQNIPYPMQAPGSGMLMKFPPSNQTHYPSSNQ